MKKPERDPAKWEITAESSLLKTPVFELRQYRAICPRNKTPGDYFVLTCGLWVNVVALTPDENLVMIRQYRHGSREVEWEIPGGLVEPGENPLDAARRELREETGYVAEKGMIIGVVNPNPALQSNLCYTVFFPKAEPKDNPEFDPGEDILTLPVPLHEVEKMILDGSIRHGLVLNALQFYRINR